jgi:hypothetical protein
LNPLLPGLESNFSTLTLSTERFCATWLWFFSREYRFPRALIMNGSCGDGHRGKLCGRGGIYARLT